MNLPLLLLLLLLNLNDPVAVALQLHKHIIEGMVTLLLIMIEGGMHWDRELGMIMLANIYIYWIFLRRQNVPVVARS